MTEAARPGPAYAYRASPGGTLPFLGNRFVNIGITAIAALALAVTLVGEWRAHLAAVAARDGDKFFAAMVSSVEASRRRAAEISASPATKPVPTLSSAPTEALAKTLVAGAAADVVKSAAQRAAPPAQTRAAKGPGRRTSIANSPQMGQARLPRFNPKSTPRIVLPPIQMPANTKGGDFSGPPADGKADYANPAANAAAAPKAESTAAPLADLPAYGEAPNAQQQQAPPATKSPPKSDAKAK